MIMKGIEWMDYRIELLKKKKKGKMQLDQKRKKQESQLGFHNKSKERSRKQLGLPANENQ